jgi:hypothetical protein
MKLAALAAAALLAPTLAAGPQRSPQVVSIVVSHPTGPPDVAKGFVAGDGRVVTVAHVLGGGGAEVAVDGRPAAVARVDRRLDLAVLRVAGLEGEAARLGSGGDTRLLGRAAPVVRRISARVDGSRPRPALEVGADVAAGESGAPVVTATGRVAGVIFARSRTRARTAYAVDAAAVAELLR